MPNYPGTLARDRYVWLILVTEPEYRFDKNMFDNLTERLGKTVKNLRGQGRLTEQNVKDALREVRMALLEADVALPVVKQFIASVQAKALGKEVLGSLSPGQSLIKVVNDELVSIMGEQSENLNQKNAR